MEKYFTSLLFHCVLQAIPAHTATPSVFFQQPHQKKPFKSLKSEVEKYTKIKAGSVDNLNPNQTLKTESSRRFVPIHSQLLAQGLLDFIRERKGHLFPELTLHLGSYGYYFNRWFTRFRGKHSLSEYHSLRHYALVTEAVISLINSSSLKSSGAKLGCIAVSGYLAYFSNSM
nr:hypothetical protein [uncultured Enterobacter sp.]